MLANCYFAMTLERHLSQLTNCATHFNEICAQKHSFAVQSRHGQSTTSPVQCSLVLRFTRCDVCHFFSTCQGFGLPAGNFLCLAFSIQTNTNLLPCGPCPCRLHMRCRGPDQTGGSTQSKAQHKFVTPHFSIHQVQDLVEACPVRASCSEEPVKTLARFLMHITVSS